MNLLATELKVIMEEEVVILIYMRISVSFCFGGTS